MSYTPADQEACADHLGKLALAAEMLEREIESETDDEINKLIRDPLKWITWNLLEDESKILARILFLGAFKSTNPEFVGQWIIDMTRQLVRKSVEAGIEE